MPRQKLAFVTSCDAHMQPTLLRHRNVVVRPRLPQVRLLTVAPLALTPTPHGWAGTYRHRASNSSEVSHSTIGKQQLLHAWVLKVGPSHDASTDFRSVGLFCVALCCETLAKLHFNHWAQVLRGTAGVPIWVLTPGTCLQENFMRTQ